MDGRIRETVSSPNDFVRYQRRDCAAVSVIHTRYIKSLLDYLAYV